MAKAKTGETIVITRPMSICYGVGDEFVVLSEKTKCVEVEYLWSTMLVCDSEYDVK